MSKPSKEQIADEAVAQLNTIAGTERRQAKQIILAAIDKATDEPMKLLRSVHDWFMTIAPQHYNGCGLWIDVDAFLQEHPAAQPQSRGECRELLRVDKDSDFSHKGGAALKAERARVKEV